MAVFVTLPSVGERVRSASALRVGDHQLKPSKKAHCALAQMLRRRAFSRAGISSGKVFDD
jgi:hypothetical protein